MPPCAAQRLPGILAATGMLLLLVMSVVALWPPTDGSPLVPRVQAAQASFPKRLFDKCGILSLHNLVSKRLVSSCRITLSVP